MVVLESLNPRSRDFKFTLSDTRRSLITPPGHYSLKTWQIRFPKKVAFSFDEIIVFWRALLQRYFILVSSFCQNVTWPWGKYNSNFQKIYSINFMSLDLAMHNFSLTRSQDAIYYIYEVMWFLCDNRIP